MMETCEIVKVVVKHHHKSASHSPLPPRLLHFRADSIFFSSSLQITTISILNTPSVVCILQLTLAALRTRPRCHHRPNSPPINVYSPSVSRPPPPLPSLPINIVSDGSTHTFVRKHVPSTGKSSNSSSSSNCAAGFWVASGCESSLLSETIAFVVPALLLSAAPDIVADSTESVRRYGGERGNVVGRQSSSA